MDDDALEDDGPVDPLADLLFTLIAAVLPAILLLAPTLERTRPAPAQAATERTSPGVTVDGRTAAIVVAGSEGLRLPAGAGSVGLDRIGDDQRLRDTLRDLAGADMPLVLVVEPDGLESAFLFEPVAAAYGPTRIAIVRANEACAKTRDGALAEACKSSPVR